jgi:hypothetical protein
MIYAHKLIDYPSGGKPDQLRPDRYKQDHRTSVPEACRLALHYMGTNGHVRVDEDWEIEIVARPSGFTVNTERLRLTGDKDDLDYVRSAIYWKRELGARDTTAALVGALGLFNNPYIDLLFGLDDFDVVAVLELYRRTNGAFTVNEIITELGGVNAINEWRRQYNKIGGTIDTRPALATA